jgi:hypothetical protein
MFRHPGWISGAAGLNFFHFALLRNLETEETTWKRPKHCLVVLPETKNLSVSFVIGGDVKFSPRYGN